MGLNERESLSRTRTHYSKFHQIRAISHCCTIWKRWISPWSLLVELCATSGSNSTHTSSTVTRIMVLFVVSQFFLAPSGRVKAATMLRKTNFSTLRIASPTATYSTALGVELPLLAPAFTFSTRDIHVCQLPRAAPRRRRMLSLVAFQRPDSRPSATCGDFSGSSIVEWMVLFWMTDRI